MGDILFITLGKRDAQWLFEREGKKLRWQVRAEDLDPMLTGDVQVVSVQGYEEPVDNPKVREDERSKIGFPIIERALDKIGDVTFDQVFLVYTDRAQLLELVQPLWEARNPGAKGHPRWLRSLREEPIKIAEVVQKYWEGIPGAEKVCPQPPAAVNAAKYLVEQQIEPLRAVSVQDACNMEEDSELAEYVDLREESVLTYLDGWFDQQFEEKKLSFTSDSQCYLVMSGGMPYVNSALSNMARYKARLFGATTHVAHVPEFTGRLMWGESRAQTYLSILVEAIEAARNTEFGQAAAYIHQLVPLATEAGADLHTKRIIQKWQKAAQSARDLLESGDPNAKGVLTNLDLGCHLSNFWDKRTPAHILSKIEWTFKTGRHVMCLTLLVSCADLICARIAELMNWVQFDGNRVICRPPHWDRDRTHKRWDGFHTEKFIETLRDQLKDLPFSGDKPKIYSLLEAIQGTLSSSHPQSGRTLRDARNEYVHHLVPIEPEFLGKIEGLKAQVKGIYSQLQQKSSPSPLAKTLGADIYRYWPDMLSRKMVANLKTAHPWR